MQRSDNVNNIQNAQNPITNVYFASLEELEPHISASTEVLDDFEQSRAARYKAEKARHTFTLARFIAKIQLAKIFQCEPQDIVFQYSENKKPYINRTPKIHFSISHNASHICVGISPYNIGIDIESLRRNTPWEKAATMLNEDALIFIKEGESDAEKHRRFCMIWCATEARVKVKDSSLFMELHAPLAKKLIGPGDQQFSFEDIHYQICSINDELLLAMACHVNHEVKIWHWSLDENMKELSV